MARPPKIAQTVELRDGSTLTYSEAIIAALEAGAFVEDAAARVGIDKSTVYNWLRRGREHKDPGVFLRGKRAGEPRPIEREHRPYVEFFHAVTRARGHAVVSSIELITAAGTGTAAVFERDDSGRIVFDRQGKPIVLMPAAAPDWRARAWYLERTDPKRFGRRIEVDTEPDDREPERIDEEIAAASQAAFRDAYLPDDLIDDVVPGLAS